MNNQTKSTLQVAIETLVLADSKHPIEKYLYGSTLDKYLDYVLNNNRGISSSLLARKHMSDEDLKEVYKEDRAKRVFILLNKKELLENNFNLTEKEIKEYSDFKNNFDFTNFLISNNIENSSSTLSDVEKEQKIDDYFNKRTSDLLSLLLNPDDEYDDSIKEIKY